MVNAKNMLVVIDSESDEQPALQQAAEIATAYGATLTALLCVYDRAAEIDTVLGGTLLHNLRKPLIEKKREWLNSLLAPLKEKGLEVITKVEWARKAHVYIDSLVEKEDFGLVIKSSVHHPLLKRIVFTPDDWHLIRSCKASLLFVHRQETLFGGGLLLALDVVDDGESVDEMNHYLLAETRALATKLSMDVNLVNAYPSVYLFASFAPQEYSPPIIQKSIKDAHVKAIESLAERYNIPTDQVYLREGLVGQVVSDVAKDLAPNLVVVGSLSREGASAFFVGNSAESVLESIDRNLLVLKK